MRKPILNIHLMILMTVLLSVNVHTANTDRTSVLKPIKVIKNPEPFVLFNDFGDNALIFEVHFWLSMVRLIERRVLESDIRFRIDELFREAGIVIAFPQRDVHMYEHKDA